MILFLQHRPKKIPLPSFTYQECFYVKEKNIFLDTDRVRIAYARWLPMAEKIKDVYRWGGNTAAMLSESLLLPRNSKNPRAEEPGANVSQETRQKLRYGIYIFGCR